MKFILLLASLHLGPGADEYTNVTPGVGLQFENGITALAYNNSIKKLSVGAYYDTKWPSLTGRFVVGAVSGYPSVEYYDNEYCDMSSGHQICYKQTGRIVRPWEKIEYKGFIPMAGYFKSFKILDQDAFIGATLPGVVSVGLEF